MAIEITRVFRDSIVRRLAGAQAYQRGMEYFTRGQVESLEEVGGRLRAVVRGGQEYSVTLAQDKGVPEYSCDCPMGREGDFCKHCVAAAVALLSGVKPVRGKAKTAKLTLADAVKVLEGEEKETLVRLISGWAEADEGVGERLIQFAARRLGPETGIAEAKRALKKAFSVRGYLQYREAASWADGVGEAIDAVEELLEDGHAAAVVGLCEWAIQSLIEAMGSVDDSDGHFMVLRDRLEEVHYRACEIAAPEPAGLARRLFQFEMHGDFEVFSNAAERYAKILGKKGLLVYRELAEAEWAEVPVRGPSTGRFEVNSHFRITEIKKSLARASGDIEELVEVMSRDLSVEYRYLQIGMVYREAGQADKALAWAEKGLAAFPTNTDSRLREFAAEEYQRRGRHGDAMKLIWAVFDERLSLQGYQLLEKYATRAGDWPGWRDRALAEVRQRIGKARATARSSYQPRWMQADAGHSMLVEIFLYEGNGEDAWREAEAGGCSERLWLRLAEEREKKHPADAAPVYLRLADEAVAAVQNSKYDHPVWLLTKAAGAMKQAGRGTEFQRLLVEMLAKYKAKRNLIKLVEQKRKSLYLT